MKIQAMILATMIMSGCSSTADRLDNLEMQVFAAQEQARVATVVAARAEQIAVQADANSVDAIEAVSRMAEKCCRK
jgi:outer membrane murein-binding lipoprotein Lpp